MGAQQSLDGNVHVVVVGGGFGGITAAQRLKSEGIRFTLIDVRDAFHHNVASLRASVQPGFAQRTFIPYSKTFGESFVQGRVQHVDMARQMVVLQEKMEIPFTHLILCTGTDGPFPGKFNQVASYHDAVQRYEDFAKEVQAADSVLVVGGGSTGVEMAAEIKTEYPAKKVVLVHSRMGLADPELLPSVRNEAKEVLLRKGVQLLLGHKVNDLAKLHLNATRRNMSVTTDKGETLTTDLIINCAGLWINNEAYRDDLSECMSDNGSLKVNQHLQVLGFSNVFAVGDCADIKEPKMAYHAQLHSAVAVTNIVNSLRGRELTSYRTGNVTMLLAMGRDDGVGQFNGLKLPKFSVVLGKSRDLLLWKSWREMKQKEG